MSDWTRDFENLNKPKEKVPTNEETKKMGLGILEWRTVCPRAERVNFKEGWTVQMMHLGVENMSDGQKLGIKHVYEKFHIAQDLEYHKNSINHLKQDIEPEEDQ